MTRKLSDYRRYGTAAPVCWLIDELTERQIRRTESIMRGDDPDWPAVVAHVDELAEARRRRQS